MIKNALNLLKVTKDGISRNCVNLHNYFAGIINSLLDVAYTATGQQTFFIEQYHDEVIHVFNLMNTMHNSDHRQTRDSNRKELFDFVFHNPESFKRLLQHIYTSNPDDKRFYMQFVNYIYLHNNPEKITKPFDIDSLFDSLMSVYHAEKRFYTNLNYPDFGACDYCLKHIGKYSKVKQHKRFLENSNPDMWDFYKLQEKGNEITDKVFDEMRNKYKN